MSTVSSPRDIQSALLQDGDLGDLTALLDADPITTLYLRSLVHEFGVAPTRRTEHGRFYGARRDGALAAVLFLGNSRNFTTYGRLTDVASLVRRTLDNEEGPRLFVGPAEHADLCRIALAHGRSVPFVDRDQPYYVLVPSDLSASDPLPIRRATRDDLDQVTMAQAAMTEEDLGIPRTHLDLGRLRQISRSRIQAGKVWVVMEGKDLLFKTEEAARTPDGVVVGGVFTHAEYRGRGLATRGLAAWAQVLFAQGVQHVALHVNARNAPAIKAYERVGFRPHSMLRLILAY